MEILKKVVEKGIEDPRERLTRLIKYTTGEAKDLIKHCIQQSLSEGYKNALELLRIRYGDPLKVLATYRKEFRRWPTIKAGDASSFRSFHNFLLKCQNVTSNQTWNALDSPDTLCLIIAKFPRHISDRWNRQVLAIRKRRSRNPSLADLIAFAKEETLLAILAILHLCLLRYFPSTNLVDRADNFYTSLYFYFSSFSVYPI